MSLSEGQWHRVRPFCSLSTQKSAFTLPFSTMVFLTCVVWVEGARNTMPQQCCFSWGDNRFPTLLLTAGLLPLPWSADTCFSRGRGSWSFSAMLLTHVEGRSDCPTLTKALGLLFLWPCTEGPDPLALQTHCHIRLESD